MRVGLCASAQRSLRRVPKTYKHIFMSGEDQQNRPAAGSLSRAHALGGLRAAGEATRLRILALLARGELNVKDLTQILGQSQPRISRHLKLMAEAGLITRFREGSWVFFRLPDAGSEAALASAIVASLDAADPVFARDRARASAVKKVREDAAQSYFKEHAGEWDKIRALHVAEKEVEAAVDEALGPGPFTLLVDLGTGTGRMLELFAARATRARLRSYPRHACLCAHEARVRRARPCAGPPRRSLQRAASRRRRRRGDPPPGATLPRRSCRSCCRRSAALEARR